MDAKQLIPEIDIKKKLLEITKKGFIKSLRKGDTGIGFTLEMELGIKENNLQNEDFTYQGNLVELKAQRKDTTSNITLFTKEPVKDGLKDRDMIKKYGYINSNNRKALKITLTTKHLTSKGLKLEIDREQGKIFVTHKKDGRLWFWTIDELKLKIQHLLLVFAERKKEGKDEYFHYNEAYYFTEFNEQKFFKLIEDGRIVVDLRMHIKPSGVVRNHGTAFRIINIRDIERCYDKKEKII